jgi:AraC-like DNA-binding protein
MTPDSPEQIAFEERLRRAIDAYHEAALAYTAVRLGLPDRLGERPVTADALASALGLSPTHLRRLLRGLAAIGVCEELPDGAFALAPGGEALRAGSPSRLDKKASIVVEQYWRPWSELASTVATGISAFEHVFGTPVAEWRRRHAEQGALFDAYLAGETRGYAAEVAGALDLGRVATVAEIGGGYGGLLAALLAANRALRGILFEEPHRLEGARAFLKPLGLDGRVTLLAGDILTEIPVEADLYLLNGVLRLWDDARAGAILEACRRAMPDGARVAIIERLMPERATDDPAAVMLDLHMMAITGGKTRSLDEFKALFAGAGLKLIRVGFTPVGLAVVEAITK